MPPRKIKMKNRRLQNLFQFDPLRPILPCQLIVMWGNLDRSLILRMPLISARNPPQGTHLLCCLNDKVISESLHSRSWRQLRRISAAPSWLVKADLVGFIGVWFGAQKIHIKKSILLLNNWVEEACRWAFFFCISLVISTSINFYIFSRYNILIWKGFFLKTHEIWILDNSSSCLWSYKFIRVQNIEISAQDVWNLVKEWSGNSWYEDLHAVPLLWRYLCSSQCIYSQLLVIFHASFQTFKFLQGVNFCKI